MMSVAHRLAIVGCSVQHSAGVSIGLSILYISLNFQFIFTNAAAAHQQHQQMNGRQWFLSAADMTSDYCVYLRRQLLLLDLACRKPGLTAVRRACERSNNPICTSTSGFCPPTNCNVQCPPNCNAQCPCPPPNCDAQCPCPLPNCKVQCPCPDCNGVCACACPLTDCAKDCPSPYEISKAEFCEHAVTTAPSGTITGDREYESKTCVCAISVPGKTINVSCKFDSTYTKVAAVKFWPAVDIFANPPYLNSEVQTSYEEGVFLIAIYNNQNSHAVCKWTSSAETLHKNIS